MTFDHNVKVNGEWYKAGEEVPALATKEPKTKTEETTVDATVDNSVVKKTYNRKSTK